MAAAGAVDAAVVDVDVVAVDADLDAAASLPTSFAIRIIGNFANAANNYSEIVDLNKTKTKTKM